MPFVRLLWHWGFLGFPLLPLIPWWAGTVSRPSSTNVASLALDRDGLTSHVLGRVWWLRSTCCCVWWELNSLQWHQLERASDLIHILLLFASKGGKGTLEALCRYLGWVGRVLSYCRWVGAGMGGKVSWKLIFKCEERRKVLLRGECGSCWMAECWHGVITLP